MLGGRRNIKRVWPVIKHRTLSHRHLKARTKLAIFGVGVLLLVAGALSLGHWWHERRYVLNPRIASLIGSADKQVLSKVSYVKSGWVLANPKPAAPNSLTVGTAPNKTAFGFNLPEHLNQGLSVTDPQTQLTMTMIPLNPAAPGKLIGQHFIYPLGIDNSQAVYTAKENGLLGVIVLPHGGHKTVTFSYRLKLPKTLVARTLPGGSVGIYSASPLLFGHISGDSKDTALLAQGKFNAPKNNLVFVIPVPTIESTNSKKTSARVAPLLFCPPIAYK